MRLAFLGVDANDSQELPDKARHQMLLCRQKTAKGKEALFAFHQVIQTRPSVHDGVNGFDQGGEVCSLKEGVGAQVWEEVENGFEATKADKLVDPSW